MNRWTCHLAGKHTLPVCTHRRELLTITMYDAVTSARHFPSALSDRNTNSCFSSTSSRTRTEFEHWNFESVPQIMCYVSVLKIRFARSKMKLSVDRMWLKCGVVGPHEDDDDAGPSNRVPCRSPHRRIQQAMSHNLVVTYNDMTRILRIKYLT